MAKRLCRWGRRWAARQRSNQRSDLRAGGSAPRAGGSAPRAGGLSAAGRGLSAAGRGLSTEGKGLSAAGKGLGTEGKGLGTEGKGLGAARRRALPRWPPAPLPRPGAARRGAHRLRPQVALPHQLLLRGRRQRGLGAGKAPEEERRGKMDAVQPGRAEPQERPSRRAEDRLSPELRPERFLLLSMDGKLLGPELSRIRSELSLPAADLPQDLPPGYLCRQRRSLPPLPPPPGPPAPAHLRSSCDVLCAGRFPVGLSRVVTGLQTPGSPPRRGRPLAPGSTRGEAGR
ncbi:uncharacterized protein [Melanerpes formicivorus]|uniref:uncharacterized protein n=1 Tax=Melanerpes formicivorus TaxID=211600 RepID=UPI00358E65B3